MRYARTCMWCPQGRIAYARTVMDAKNHCRGQPDGAAFQWLLVMGYGLLKGEFDTLVGNGGVAAPERPSNKEKHRFPLTTRFNALFSRFACFSLLIKCVWFPPCKSKKIVFSDFLIAKFKFFILR